MVSTKKVWSRKPNLFVIRIEITKSNMRFVLDHVALLSQLTWASFSFWLCLTRGSTGNIVFLTLFTLLDRTCCVSPEQQWGQISGSAPPACQHRPLAQKEDYQPVQVGASPPAHVQTDHLHCRSAPLVQRAWSSVQGGLCHWWDWWENNSPQQHITWRKKTQGFSLKQTVVQFKRIPRMQHWSLHVIVTVGERCPKASRAGVPENAHTKGIFKLLCTQLLHHCFISILSSGLCGGSASGKTTVARKIIEALDVPWVVLLSMDSFYKVHICSTHVLLAQFTDVI